MQNDGMVQTHDILARLRRRLGASNDRDLAAQLGVSTSTLSSWRQRNSMPYSFCVEVALAEKFSLDWLILGQERGGMDVHAAFLAFTHIQRMSRSSSIDFEKVDVAEIIEPFAAAYDRILTLLENEMEKGGSREEAATYIGEVMKVLLQAPLSSDFELVGLNFGRRSNRQERNPCAIYHQGGSRTHFA